MKTKLPDWFRQKVNVTPEMKQTMSVLDRVGVNTVCESALCPNRCRCYSQGTATFMILGNTCTRNCAFCAVASGKPEPVDADEGEKIGLVISELGLRYAVITSVTRDDLPDGGAEHFAKVVREVKEMNIGLKVEVLIPDFSGKEESLQTVLDENPDVVGHNIETVPRLYSRIRQGADYERSIKLLGRIKSSGNGVLAKSGLMFGLGETEVEIIKVMNEVAEEGCDILTLGQYLQPSDNHSPVKKYFTPEEFSRYKKIAYGCGFKAVVSSPLVRSSFMAADVFDNVRGISSLTDGGQAR